MKKWYFAVAVMLTFLGVNQAFAVDGVSFASGYGAARIKPARLGVQWNWDKDWLQDCKWPGNIYWEASFYHMMGKKGNTANSNGKISAIALTPVFRFNKPTDAAHKPYAEIAFGLSQMNKREIGGRNLGINFQFEDRLSLGFKFGNKQQYDLSYRIIHFSNAYIGKKNHGINLHTLVFGYWFG